MVDKNNNEDLNIVEKIHVDREIKIKKFIDQEQIKFVDIGDIDSFYLAFMKSINTAEKNINCVFYDDRYWRMILNEFIKKFSDNIDLFIQNYLIGAINRWDHVIIPRFKYFVEEWKLGSVNCLFSHLLIRLEDFEKNKPTLIQLKDTVDLLVHTLKHIERIDNMYSSKLVLSFCNKLVYNPKLVDAGLSIMQKINELTEYDLEAEIQEIIIESIQKINESLSFGILKKNHLKILIKFVYHYSAIVQSNLDVISLLNKLDPLIFEKSFLLNEEIEFAKVLAPCISAITDWKRHKWFFNFLRSHLIFNNYHLGYYKFYIYLLREILLYGVDDFQKLFGDQQLLDGIALPYSSKFSIIVRMFIIKDVLTQGFSLSVPIDIILALIRSVSNWKWEMWNKILLIQQLSSLLVSRAVNHQIQNSIDVREQIDDLLLKEIIPGIKKDLIEMGIGEEKIMDLGKKLTGGNRGIKLISHISLLINEYELKYKERDEIRFKELENSVKNDFPNLYNFENDFTKWNKMLKKWVIRAYDKQQYNSELLSQLMEKQTQDFACRNLILWDSLLSNSNHSNFWYLKNQFLRILTRIEEYNGLIDKTSELRFLLHLICSKDILNNEYKVLIEKEHPGESIKKKFDIALVDKVSDVVLLADVYRIRQSMLDEAIIEKFTIEPTDPSRINDMSDLNLYVKHAAEKILKKLHGGKPENPHKDPGRPVILMLDITYNSEGNDIIDWQEMNHEVLNKLFVDWKFISGVSLLNAYVNEQHVTFIPNPKAEYPLSDNLRKLLMKFKYHCKLFNFDLDCIYI